MMRVAAKLGISVATLYRKRRLLIESGGLASPERLPSTISRRALQTGARLKGFSYELCSRWGGDGAVAKRGCH